MDRNRFTFAALLALIAIASMIGDAIGADEASYSRLGLRPAILPMAVSPTGMFGGMVSGEFDRRTIGGELVYLRRANLLMGYSPTSKFAIWAEGGVASIQLFIDDREPSGAYGPAVGLGWSYTEPRFTWRDYIPFISGRATYLQSKLSDDVRKGATPTSRRSRFEWREVTFLLGESKVLDEGTSSQSLLYGAFAIRHLSQKEYRSLRSGASFQRNLYDYTSGLRPGVMFGWQRQFSHRVTLRLGAEVYPEGGRLSLSLGQWGTP